MSSNPHPQPKLSGSTLTLSRLKRQTPTHHQLLNHNSLQFHSMRLIRMIAQWHLGQWPTQWNDLSLNMGKLLVSIWEQTTMDTWTVRHAKWERDKTYNCGNRPYSCDQSRDNWSANAIASQQHMERVLTYARCGSWCAKTSIRSTKRRACLHVFLQKRAWKRKKNLRMLALRFNN